MDRYRNSLAALSLFALSACERAAHGPSKYDKAEAEGLIRLRAGTIEYSRVNLGYGEAIELRLPDSLLPEIQSFDHRCLLYRDLEFKAATLSCLPSEELLPSSVE